MAKEVYRMEKFQPITIEKNEQYLRQISKKVNVDDAEKIKSIVQDFLSLNKPTSEIMKVIINRIEIHQDKQVDLYFNFKQLNNLKEKKCY